jgi:hypothetical protein
MKYLDMHLKTQFKLNKIRVLKVFKTDADILDAAVDSLLNELGQQETVTDEKLHEAAYLDYLIQKTPESTRLQLLKMNFEFWKNAFPKEASLFKKDSSE